MTYEGFLADIKTQDAVIRNLEIMGEAAKGLSPPRRAKYPEVPWKGLAGTRDRRIHHYFGVNLDIVCGIITGKLTDLESQVEKIMRNEGCGG